MSRVGNALRPKNDMFFSLFEAAGDNIVVAAGLLDETLHAFPDRPDLAAQVRDCEHRGDEITHELVQRLNNTFVPPIDRDVAALQWIKQRHRVATVVRTPGGSSLAAAVRPGSSVAPPAGPAKPISFSPQLALLASPA